MIVGAEGTPSKGAACSSFLRGACQEGSAVQTHAMQYGISYKYNQDFSGGNLTNFDMNLGMFMASRGPYAWLGCACLPSMSVCHLVLDRACWWGRRVDGVRLRLGAQRQDALRHLPAPGSARRRLVSALAAHLFQTGG